MAETTPNNPNPAALAALPTVHTKLSPAEVAARLQTASKRGRMPGFVAGQGRSSQGLSGGQGPADPHGRLLCTLDAFGMPFDGVLELRARSAVSPGGSVLRGEAKLKPTMPWVFAVMLLLSIWPGVVLTESLVATFIPGDFWKWTWWWYLPLTVPTSPWVMWVAVKKSRVCIKASAVESLQKVAAEVEGELVPGGGA